MLSYLLSPGGARGGRSGEGAIVSVVIVTALRGFGLLTASFLVVSELAACASDGIDSQLRAAASQAVTVDEFNALVNGDSGGPPMSFVPIADFVAKHTPAPGTSDGSALELTADFKEFCIDKGIFSSPSAELMLEAFQRRHHLPTPMACACSARVSPCHRLKVPPGSHSSLSRRRSASGGRWGYSNRAICAGRGHGVYRSRRGG